MAGKAAAAAVDWQQEVAALRGSAEWQQLLVEELPGTAAGGPSVASLLRRAAAAAEAHGSSAGGTGGAARLAQVVQQAAWEKLHTGDWHSVPVVWRDAYVAACILAAAAGLPSRGGGGSGGDSSGRQAAEAAPPAAALEAAAAAAAEAAALSAGLWHLDMATIMGGALLRPRVDALIDRLQRRWQALHRSAPATEQQLQRGDGQEGAAEEESGGQPAAKRQRGADAAAGEGHVAMAAAAEAVEAALLPPWSLGPRGSPVASAELPSLEAFWRHYMSTDTPVVISGAMEDWPALHRWGDPSYLVSVAGPRTVPVEVGEHYLSEQWGQQLMTLQQFVQQHVLGGAGGGQPAAGRPSPQLEEQQAEAAEQQHQHHQQQEPSEAQRAQRGYLAQHPLFDQIPALAADIREPLYCCLGEGEVQAVNAWFGPAGTVTPLHTDPHANLLCQAAGRKYVRLYPPAATPAMYPHSAEGMHGNSGQVDVGAPDLQRFPLFGEAPFQDCVLEAGQMLFIPPGWWHYLQSTSVSFSVSYWWR